jgi:hypothetical protein
MSNLRYSHYPSLSVLPCWLPSPRGRVLFVGIRALLPLVTPTPALPRPRGRELCGIRIYD